MNNGVGGTADGALRRRTVLATALGAMPVVALADGVATGGRAAAARPDPAAPPAGTPWWRH
ncbi:hypothetical protein [Streptomyces thermodiastaticus]|jgi:hypothetical protein|uniref:hypothetical protein n=1 Tax=Streptomyces thermodiastaticus TaxID=44061 RepID=UPI00167675A9|nr:hypothetical protein [Streptomyces thermodiastaticus]GHF93390.1 hypothetical protein GCM10018787_47770 [Streptomyces thermodiastaticus]